MNITVSIPTALTSIPGGVMATPFIDSSLYLKEQGETTLSLRKMTMGSLMGTLVTNNLSFLNLKKLKNKAVHYLTERDDKYLSTKLVPLTKFKELRSDDRNSWERFYKTYRLAQYPKITINNIRD